MLLADFEVLGFWDGEIYFKFENKILMLKKRLPREDLILKLRIEPEEYREMKDAILFDAASKPLTYEKRCEFLKECNDRN